MLKLKNILFTNFSIVLIFFIISPQVLSKSNVVDSAENIPLYEVMRYKKDFELDFKRGTINIINHYGNVVVKNTTHHTVGLSAVVQEIGNAPAIHKLEINHKKNKLILEIKYTKADLKKHKNTKLNFPVGRVDLVVFIPVDHKIDVQTTFGKIDFKRVKNPIKSLSESGAINASSYYDIEAQSVSGQIKAFPMGIQWDKGVKLKSQSGVIYAIIPVNANVELDVKSKGKVKSQLESIREWTVIANKFKKSYGENGKSYRIQNKSGAVYLSPHESVK